MSLGTRTDFLIEFLSHIDIDGRVIVLADLAELGHGYKAGDMLKAYKELKTVCESWDISDVDDFKSDMYEFVQENYLKLRSKVGDAAMSNVVSITEDEEDDKANDNKKAFEKEAEKQKKSEQSPIAKAKRAKGQTQDDMAASTSVDKSTISRWKTGTRKPSFDNLKKIKKQYGMAVVNQLLGS